MSESVGKVEIISIGNELLIGKVLNTNAHWLAKRITSLGLSVRRVTVVGDDLDEISSAVKEAIQRRPAFIITTGGLGPTFDDKTLEGVAMATNRELEENKEALEMIKRRYEEYVAEGKMERFELTQYRVKMARLPRGAKPLPNPVGTAPGVLLEHEGVTLIMLPGVPGEMMAIFENSVLPLLRKAAGNMVFYETSLDITGIVESDLAPLIEQVMRENPYVYIKSHPKITEKIKRIELHLSTTCSDENVARQRIEKTIMQISSLISERGGKVQPIQI
ncbi:MAG: nicotinamide mononucleotide deamidase-related protein [Candidatus Bathyarchaeia archaeon]|nr:nicotinamide mononucleotide deamidase-related protein [Candidatus Bathyarchaeota archaeon]